jgi:hypothetical protein
MSGDFILCCWFADRRQRDLLGQPFQAIDMTLMNPFFKLIAY